MRKWRPTFRCLYIIPEIHGNMQSLEVILNRVLPLRKFKNQEDILVMLGDYIDGEQGSAEVIDTLINIKEEYKERAIFLKGNHEESFIRAMLGSDFDFNSWMNMGGLSTISSYVKKYHPNVIPSNISRNRLSQIVPKAHLEFLQSLENFRVLDNYVFFHGSFDHNKSIANNSINNFIFDSTASRYVKECINKRIAPEFLDDYIFVGAHNFNSDELFIHPRYFMLGGTAPARLVVFELNSMTACAATRGKSRIYKHDFKVFE